MDEPHVFIGADHRGFAHKEALKSWLQDQGFAVTDVGSFEYDSTDDYPDVANELGNQMLQPNHNRALGILLCGTSVGVTVAANKIDGLRAAPAISEEEVIHGRTADDLNVLTLGADELDLETARQLILAFLTTPFQGEERHLRRLEKVEELEDNN